VSEKSARDNRTPPTTTRRKQPHRTLNCLSPTGSTAINLTAPCSVHDARRSAHANKKTPKEHKNRVFFVAFVFARATAHTHHLVALARIKARVRERACVCVCVAKHSERPLKRARANSKSPPQRTRRNQSTSSSLNANTRQTTKKYAHHANTAHNTHTLLRGDPRARDFGAAEKFGIQSRSTDDCLLARASDRSIVLMMSL
jgi:hypothetical protein